MVLPFKAMESLPQYPKSFVRMINAFSPHSRRSWEGNNGFLWEGRKGHLYQNWAPKHPSGSGFRVPVALTGEIAGITKPTCHPKTSCKYLCGEINSQFLFFGITVIFLFCGCLGCGEQLKRGGGWCTAQNLGHTCALDGVRYLVHFFLSPNAFTCGAKWWQMCSLCVCMEEYHTSSWEAGSPAAVLGVQ